MKVWRIHIKRREKGKEELGGDMVTAGYEFFRNKTDALNAVKKVDPPGYKSNIHQKIDAMNVPTTGKDALIAWLNEHAGHPDNG